MAGRVLDYDLTHPSIAITLPRRRGCSLAHLSIVIARQRLVCPSETAEEDNDDDEEEEEDEDEEGKPARMTAEIA